MYKTSTYRNRHIHIYIDRYTHKRNLFFKPSPHTYLTNNCIQPRSPIRGRKCIFVTFRYAKSRVQHHIISHQYDDEVYAHGKFIFSRPLAISYRISLSTYLHIYLSTYPHIYLPGIYEDRQDDHSHTHLKFRLWKTPRRLRTTLGILSID